VNVVIPAAGLGVRFRPLSRIVPKELLPMGGKPLIHHALEEADRAGFEQAVVVLSPTKSSIREYFELAETRELARRLRLAFVEQPKADGLGQAVLLAARRMGADRFAVLLPDDVVTDSEHWRSLVSLNDATGAATLCLRQVDPSQTGRFGIAACSEVDGRLWVTGLIEKPIPLDAPSDLAVFGRYMVTKAVIDALESLSRQAEPQRELQLTDGVHLAAGAAPGVLAVHFKSHIFDAGTPEEYALSLARFVRSSAGGKPTSAAAALARN
jgi:UTP--glucose-1-phosphate uridylyltransferase